jgi:CHAT domain-containing protein
MHGKAALAGMFLLVTSAPFTPFSSSVKPPTLRPSLQALREKGRTLLETKEYARAEQVLQVGLREALRLDDQAAAASFLNFSGCAQFDLFQYRQALQSFQEAHRLALRTGRGELVAMSSLNLSSLYLQQSDLNSALRAAEDGLRLSRRYAASKRGPLFKAQVGVLYARNGQLDSALQLLSESAQEADSRGDSETLAMVLNQIGYEYLKAGKSQSAEGPLLGAFRLLRLTRSPNLTYSYLALGMLRLAQKDPDPRSACALLDRAVALSADSSVTLPLWRFYYQRGLARMANGNLAEALPDLEKSMESATRLRAELLSADSVWTGAGAEQHDVYTAYIRARAALYFSTRDSAHARYAFRALAETQATGLRALIHRSAEWRERLPAEYWETLAQLRAAEAGLLAGRTPAAKTTSSALLYKLTAMEAEAGLGPDSAEAGNPPEGAADLSRRVQETLGNEAALICFHLDEPASFRWVVTREAFELQRLPSGGKLRDAARQFKRAVSIGDPEAVSLGTKLYKDLFGSLPAGAQSRRDWILSLDGELLDAPFAALVTGGTAGKPVYLVEAHSTRVVPSALMLQKPARRSWDGPFVGVGDPIYNTADPRWRSGTSRYSRAGFGLLLSLPKLFARSNSQSTMALARLAGSGREISASMRAWDGNSSNNLFLSGSDATVGRLRDALARRPAVLHFATHFLPSAGPTPQALLALSLGRGGSPEVLGPAEISRWRQDLGVVVLSGCGSARARILPAEGLMGMTRAWLAAGAHSVIASLWSTADDNGDLFVPFYGRLAGLKTEPRTGTAAEALRRAQLEMLHSDSWHARPAYWATYFVVGKE